MTAGRRSFFFHAGQVGDWEQCVKRTVPLTRSDTHLVLDKK